MSFFRFLSTAVVLVSFLYLFCHFGNLVTFRFERFGISVSQLAWYMLPLVMQKDLPIVIAISQKNVFIRAFAGTHCNRDVFKEVIFCLIIIPSIFYQINNSFNTHIQIMKNTFSYFMVLRKFEF